jgi:hypothetical protein
MRKGHDQISADMLDVERRPVIIEARVAERVVIVGAQSVETGVEDLDPARLEVGRIKSRAAAYLGDRTSLVQRLAGAILHNHGVGIHRRIPARDRPILGHEQEERLGVGAD